MITSAVLRGWTLVCVLVLSSACSGAPSANVGDPSRVAGCEPGRKIIKIYGTGSTGQFDPKVEGVTRFYPYPPGPSVLDARVNPDFNDLLAGFEECTLTFSYDDLYLATTSRGVNAWNWVTSPWDHGPDVLADHLQRLIDSYPGATFDIVAYSAGGIVPTYWAARPATTDVQRQKVRWIVAIDAIVSGADAVALDIACLIPPDRALRRWHVGTFGRIPCQFSFNGPFTKTVRGAAWMSPSSVTRLATLRANGDLIVRYPYAGLPEKAASDPPLRAEECAPWQWIWLDGPGPAGCVLLTHGSVLIDQDARRAIVDMLGVPR